MPDETIPAGMVPWAGGESAPADWPRFGRVAFRNGETSQGATYYDWRHVGEAHDIIAYTPRPSDSAQHEVTEAEHPWSLHVAGGDDPEGVTPVTAEGAVAAARKLVRQQSTRPSLGCDCGGPFVGKPESYHSSWCSSKGGTGYPPDEARPSDADLREAVEAVVAHLDRQEALFAKAEGEEPLIGDDAVCIPLRLLWPLRAALGPAS